MTGGSIKTVSQSDYDGGKAVILALDENIEADNGGYALSITNQSIEIKAKDYSGLSGGIYAFLEDKLGCMYVSDSYDYIPKAKTVWLDECEINHTPSIEWRYVYAYEPELRTNEDGTKITAAGTANFGSTVRGQMIGMPGFIRHLLMFLPKSILTNIRNITAFIWAGVHISKGLFQVSCAGLMRMYTR